MPTGRRLDDGHSTTISFPYDPTIGLWEKEVQPPGVDGGDPVDTTTMRNVLYRTMNPRKLKTLTAATFKVAYDETHTLRIHAMTNINQLLVATFPTGAPFSFWGYLRSFIPDALVEGQQPTATVTIQPTNQNNSGAEVSPTIGTTTTTTTTTTAAP
jgi:hypothetical protein